MPWHRASWLLAMVATLQPLLGADVAVGVSRPEVVDVATAAGRIDSLVAADLADHHLKPNPPIDDLGFLRRACLDLMGRIPSAQEVGAYLTSGGSDKRHRLVDGLITSDGYVSAQFNWWADLLRVQTSLMGRFPGEPYVDYLKQAIRNDMPYDRLVASLITAQGSTLAQGNGATGYYLRDAGMPQDNMSNTIQVFMGTRLACAQCHNHPFDHWTRLGYWEMSAYTSSTRADTDPALINALKKLGQAEPGGPSKDQKEAMRRYADAIGSRVTDNAKDTVNLPKDFQYPDAKPNQVVHAHPLFGEITYAPGQSPRQAYAAWLTSPENPRFTEVIANRMWKRVMGLGLIEPVDNLLDDTSASNPALMAYLTELMKTCHYDLRLFQRILYHTKAYQRQSVTATITEPKDYHFQGPVQRRLSAEQIWDSLLTLVVPDLDKRQLSDVSAVYDYYKTMMAKSPQEIWTQIVSLSEALVKRRALSDQMRALEDAATDKQAKDALAQERRDFADLRKQQQSLDATIRDLSFDKARAAQVTEDDPRWKGLRRDFVRASELPSLRPRPGTSLRDFGQSDRNLIENANHTAAVTGSPSTPRSTASSTRTCFQPKIQC